MTLSQWKKTLTTNLTSTFLVIRAFLRQLEGQPKEALDTAAIVLIGSTAGKYGEAGERYAETMLHKPRTDAVKHLSRPCGLCSFEISNDGRTATLAQE